jgi:hypothetical protein
MEWMIKKGDIMSEVGEAEFFDQLKTLVSQNELKYVVEGPNIDIIIERAENPNEYDYWDMMGTVFVEGLEAEQINKWREETVQKLQAAGVEYGGEYEGKHS